MKQNWIKSVLQTVAKNNGVPVETVMKEIELAMEAGMKSSDPLIRARWMQIPRRGERPTAYEAIAYLSNLAQSRR